jgi:hypothetical protein
MPGDTLFHLSVTFAIVTATAAGVLALLSWEVFRHSVFGRVIFGFTVLMAIFIMYHALLMTFADRSPLIPVLESLFYTGLAVFVGVMLRVELTLSDDSSEVPIPWR